MVSKASLSGSGTGGTKATTKGTTSTNATSQSTTSGSSNSSTRVSESSISDYLDPTSRAALNQLIRSLSGNTGNSFWDKGKKGNSVADAAKQYSKERMSEIDTNQKLRADYTKQNAFADAQGAMNSSLAKALEQSMPVLTAGIDAAGTSGSAMQALLTQQAAENAARSSAELGLQAAISYGNIQTGFGDILERLTSEGDPATNQLLEALGIAKGAYAKTQSDKLGSSSSTESSTTTQVGTERSTTEQTATETPITKKKTAVSLSSLPGLSTPGYKTQALKDMSTAIKTTKSASQY